MIREKFEVERLQIKGVREFWELYDKKITDRTYVNAYKLWEHLFNMFPALKEKYFENDFSLDTDNIMHPELIVKDFRIVPTRGEALIFKVFGKKSRAWRRAEEDDDLRDKIYLGYMDTNLECK